MKLWLPVAAYMAMIFVLSSIPNPPTVGPEGSDKLAHVLLYGGLGALVVRALAGGLGRPVTVRIVIVAVMVSALYGATDEIHQHFVPPRQMDAWDLAADGVGAAASALALYAAHAMRRDG
jgi:VanZ family protein